MSLSTFKVPHNRGIMRVDNDMSETGRGYLVCNSNFVYKGAVTLGMDYEIEPGCIFWFNKQVAKIHFANEYRDFNPANRCGLANTVIKTFVAPADLVLGSGYNVTITYSGGSLLLNGNVGNGRGKAPNNMWDAGPDWDLDTSGLLSVNGVGPDSSGDIPVANSVSITLVPTEGNLDVEVL
jgi:hypothetical protein